MACVVAAREKSRGWGVYTGRERDVREGNCEDKSEKKKRTKNMYRNSLHFSRKYSQNYLNVLLTLNISNWPQNSS